MKPLTHILSTEQFTRTTLEQLFTDVAAIEKLVNEKGGDDRLKHKVVATLFYEPSTRTSSSFIAATQRLGGTVIAINDTKTTSHAKGESLQDTIRTLEQYVDCIVLRHPEIGAVRQASEVANIPVISAGDGGGEHPTQALLDLYTTKREVGRLDNLTVAFGTDLLHSRTVRSFAYMLSKFKNNHLIFVSPKELQIGEDVKTYLKKQNTTFEETDDMESALKKADVIYWNRIQKERFTGNVPAQKFVIKTTHLDLLKPDAVILNPLPRIDEIETGVDRDLRAAYFRQMRYGLYVRMALLDNVINRRTK
jgi:aspartate carbamoyltransferase catalytic subunit